MASDTSDKKREALLKVMRWSFHAGRTEEIERYAQELLLMEHRNPMRDDWANRVHVAHTLMGLIALGLNNLAVAKESLLSSAKEAPETATRPQTTDHSQRHNRLNLGEKTRKLLRLVKTQQLS